jgi:hypothetical protein
MKKKNIFSSIYLYKERVIESELSFDAFTQNEHVSLTSKIITGIYFNTSTFSLRRFSAQKEEKKSHSRHFFFFSSLFVCLRDRQVPFYSS